MPAPDEERWDADQVKARMTAALARLARTGGAQDLRGLLPMGRPGHHYTGPAYCH